MPQVEPVFARSLYTCHWLGWTSTSRPNCNQSYAFKKKKKKKKILTRRMRASTVPLWLEKLQKPDAPEGMWTDARGRTGTSVGLQKHTQCQTHTKWPTPRPGAAGVREHDFGRRVMWEKWRHQSTLNAPSLRWNLEGVCGAVINFPKRATGWRHQIIIAQWCSIETSCHCGVHGNGNRLVFALRADLYVLGWM